MNRRVEIATNLLHIPISIDFLASND